MASWGVYLTVSFPTDLRSARNWFGSVVIWTGLLVMTASHIFGQQVALSLSSASTAPGSNAVLNVSTTASGGVQPTVLQWTVLYPVDVTGIEVSPGTAAVGAGKTVTCSYGASAATCLAWGDNNAMISDGVFAYATLQISAASGKQHHRGFV